jgi:hypothetical protein
MSNTVKLTFAGDASQLAKESARAEKAIISAGKASKGAAGDMEVAGKSSRDLERSYGDLGAATAGALGAIDAVGGGMQALADVQDYARDRANRLERANIDVMQATEDMAQATRDAKQAQLDEGQAAIDLTQAKLDQKIAMREYNEAVKEHGEGSEEARQANIDLMQAGLDLEQAQEDQAQATRDASQANIDAKGAQLDLNEAMHEANPPELTQWAEKVGLVTPLLSALVGVTSLVTAVQWAWNAAQLASPTTWIIGGLVVLVGVLVAIGIKTGWLQETWRKVWDGIKSAAGAVGRWFSQDFLGFFTKLWEGIRSGARAFGEWFTTRWRNTILRNFQAIRNAALSVGRWFRDTFWNSWIKGTFNRVTDKITSTVAAFRRLRSRLAGALSNIASVVSAPFRRGFNIIADAWNNTVGRLQWRAPAALGGWSVNAPRLPKFHAGGVAPVGRETVAVLQSGEKIGSVANRGGGAVHVQVMLDSGVLVEGTAREVGRRGGNVQLVLGGRNAYA